MFRITKLNSELYQVERLHSDNTWVVARYNGQDSFTTEEKAQEFIDKLWEIDASYQSFKPLQ